MLNPRIVGATQRWSAAALVALLAACAEPAFAFDPNEPASESRPAPASQPSADESRSRVFNDAASGVRLRLPKGWRAPSRRPADLPPGDVRGVWTPDGTTMLWVMTEPGGDGVTPRFLLDLAAKSLERDRGNEILHRELRDLDGKRSARLAWIGAGRPAPFSVDRPRAYIEQWIIPIGARTLTVRFECPEGERKQLAEALARIRQSLRLRGEQSSAQRDSR